MFDDATPKALAQRADEAAGGSGLSVLLPIRARGSKPAVFGVQTAAAAPVQTPLPATNDLLPQLSAGYEDGVPAAFLDGHQIVKGLHGTLTLLFDCGFDEPEALRWLFTSDDTLPGTPIQAMAEHRGTEVNRRAQALAF